MNNIEDNIVEHGFLPWMNGIEEQLRIINERLELLEKAAISNNYWAYKRIRNKTDCQSNWEIDHLYAELNSIPNE